MHESHTRSIAKGITWRILASVTTMSLVYLFTGDLSVVATVSALEFIAKVALYYGHERIWAVIHWGKATAS